MINTSKIKIQKVPGAVVFLCNGERCRKKLGEIDPSTGHLHQQSNRWHFRTEIVEGYIECQCGWHTHYKAEDFKQC